jgi:transposase
MDKSINASTTTDISVVATTWVGIDVSKETLDVCLITGSKVLSGTFHNDQKDFQKLLKWVNRMAPNTIVHFCMEATGAYSQAIALFLAENEQRVSVINPYRIKHAAMAQGAANKTDKADARVIADYCRKEQPALWRMSAPEVRSLVALARHLDNLQEHLVQQKNRLSEPNLLPSVEQSLKSLAQHLEDQISALEADIDNHINQHPALKEDRDLLITIPGIAQTTAIRILAELPDVSEFSSAQAAAAYAGLNPAEYRSGTSVHKRTKLSKRGNARLRAALYWPAITAMRFNPNIKALVERLLPKLRVTKAIVGAAMRKLLMIAFGVLKNRKAFDPNYSRDYVKA